MTQPQVQESESADFGMDVEPLLHGLLERRDLRRGVKADVEVALADIRRVRAERDRYREALERLTDGLADVRVSGMAARTYALHEAWKDAREALDG